MKVTSSKYKVVVEVPTALLTQVLETVENEGGEVIDVFKLAVNGSADAPLNAAERVGMDGPRKDWDLVGKEAGRWGQSNLVALDSREQRFAYGELTPDERKAEQRERRLAYKRAYNKRVRAEQRRAGLRVR